MRIYLVILVMLLNTTLGMTSGSDPNQAASKIPTVSLCDLIRSPNIYNEKEVRFRAVYIAAFETQAFGSPKCIIDKDHSIWVEFDLAAIKATTKPEVLRKVEEQISCCMFAGASLEDMLVTEIVITGVLHSSDGHYGHGSQYPFMVTVKSIEEIGATKKIKAPGL